MPFIDSNEYTMNLPDAMAIAMREVEKGSQSSRPFYYVPPSDTEADDGIGVFDAQFWKTQSRFSTMSGSWRLVRDMTTDTTWAPEWQGGNEYIKQKYPEWQEDTAQGSMIRRMIIQGWFDDSRNPEMADFAYIEGQKSNYDIDQAARMSGMTHAAGFVTQMVGDPANLIAGAGLARLGYKGITGLVTNPYGKIAAGTAMGAGSNVAFEQYLNWANPATEVQGSTNEVFAAVFGSAFGMGLTGVGVAARGRGGTAVRDAISTRSLDLKNYVQRNSAMRRIAKADEALTNGEIIHRVTPEGVDEGALYTVQGAFDEGLRDLKALNAGPIQERASIMTLRPRDPKHPINLEIESLSKRSADEGWDFQILDHPEQLAYEAMADLEDIAKSPSWNAIATRKDIDQGAFDAVVGSVTSAYTRMQAFVNPGSRSVYNTLGIVQDLYRTLSGSAHTITQFAAHQPLFKKTGVTAEGKTQHLRQMTHQVVNRLHRHYKDAIAADGRSGINFDGVKHDLPAIGGRQKFETLAVQHLRRKHAQKMGYQADVTTDVHPSIVAAADEMESYFARMGDELVDAGMLPADNRLLGQYLPVTFDTRAIRNNPQKFVDDMVTAFREKDHMVNGRMVDDADVPVRKDVIDEMNREAERDLFVGHGNTENAKNQRPANPMDIEIPDAPPATGAAKLVHAIDELAESDTNGVRKQIEDMGEDWNPPKYEDSYTPTESLQARIDEPNKVPEDFPMDTAGGVYPGKPMEGIVWGDKTTVVMADPRDATKFIDVPARYALVDAGELKPSNRILDEGEYGWNVRSKNATGGYDLDPVYGKFNQRANDYARPGSGSSSVKTMDSIVAAPRAKDFWDSGTGTERGAPLVSIEGYPDSGANRTMALQRLWYGNEGPKGIDEFDGPLYSTAVEKAPEFGIPDNWTKHITADAPVLVRIMEDPVAPGHYSAAANTSVGAQMSELADVVDRSAKITDGTLAAISSRLDLDPDATLRSVLDDKAFSADLIRRMTRSGAWTERQRGLWNATTNQLEGSGKDHIEKMLAARTLRSVEDVSYYGTGVDPKQIPSFEPFDVLDGLAQYPSIKSKLSTAVPGIDLLVQIGRKKLGSNADNAGAYGPGNWSGSLSMIDSLVTKALAYYPDYKVQGKNTSILDHFYGQATITGQKPLENAAIATMVHAFDTMSPHKLRRAFVEWGKQVDQGGLFTTGGDVPSPFAIMDDLFGEGLPDKIRKQLRDTKTIFDTTSIIRQRNKPATTPTIEAFPVGEGGLAKDSARRELQLQAIDELLTFERPPNENAIALGEYGGRPEVVDNNKQYYIITGNAASGKSTMVESVVKSLKAIEMDPDILKRKLPEFAALGADGASAVHIESKEMIFAALDRAMKSGDNLASTTMGGAAHTVTGLIERANKFGYDVHLIQVDKDLHEIGEQLMFRNEATGRVIDPAMSINEVGFGTGEVAAEAVRSGTIGGMKIKSASRYSNVRGQDTKFVPMDIEAGWYGPDTPNLSFKSKSMGQKTTEDMLDGTEVVRYTQGEGGDYADGNQTRVRGVGGEEPQPVQQRVGDDSPGSGRGEDGERVRGEREPQPSVRGLPARSGSPGDQVQAPARAKRWDGVTQGDLPPDLLPRYRAKLEEQYRRGAEELRDAIADPVQGHGVAMGMLGKGEPSHLRERTLGINYNTVGDFLDQHASEMLFRYDMQVSGRIGVNRAIQTNPETWAKYKTRDGRSVKNGDDMVEAVDVYFDNLMRNAEILGDRKLAASIQKARGKVQRDIYQPMQAMLGRNPVKGAIDNDNFLAWAGRSVQRWNFVNKLGSVFWAQLNDIAPTTLQTVTNPTNLKQITKSFGFMDKLARKDLELMGLWSDQMIRVRSMADIDFNHLEGGFGTGRTKAFTHAVETSMAKVADVSGHVSGMNWITNANKRFASMLTLEKIGNESKKMLRADELMRNQGLDLSTAMKKVRLTRYRAATVNQLGMNVEAARRYHRLTYAHGVMADGRSIKETMSYAKYLRNEKDLFMPNMTEWDMGVRDNKQLAEVIQTRVNDYVNRHMVVTPGYWDRPLVNFHTWGKLFNQFQTFMTAFHHQRMVPMSQMPASHQLWYTGAYLLMGSVTDAITNHLSGRRSMSETVEKWEEDPGGMLYKAFVYSGISGPINRIWGLTDALGIPVSPGVVLNNTVGGGASQGFYWGDPGAGTVIQALGPTGSSAKTLANVLYDTVGSGEMDETTAYRAATLAPFQNNAILRMLYRTTGAPVVPEALRERD